jgi:large subunit ribosomal protein L31
MKQAIHPEVFETTVHCNGCDTTFTSHTTVPEITVEICSNCHPFYTGKQKLLDTAGRVDKFRARQAAATTKAGKQAKVTNKAEDPELAEIQNEIEAETVELPETAKDETAAKDHEVANDNAEEAAPEVHEDSVDAVEAEERHEAEAAADDNTEAPAESDSAEA